MQPLHLQTNVLMLQYYHKGVVLMERIIFHIDVNSAYLSWEALYRLNELGETLDLRTIPSAIGGDKKSRHGIILAKSTAAKKYGVKTAETLGDALKKCPQLVIVPPRHSIYKEYSQRLMKLLAQYSSAIEQFSIDEAFVDMTEPLRQEDTPPVCFANQLRQTIYDTLGFTVNIGVSSNKVLAKMASDFEKPNRVHHLFPDEIQEKMWGLPIWQLFFVGKSTAATLHNLGIRTIGELAVSDRSIICSHLGKHGALIHDYANGIDDSPVQSAIPDSKNYGNSTTISHDVTEPAEAKQILLSLCELVSRRLQKDSVRAGVVAVNIKDSSFRRYSHQCTLNTATDKKEVLFEKICTLFDERWDGSPIRLLGVSTSKITRDTIQQLNIFDHVQNEKQQKLDDALKKIRERYGEDAVQKGKI